MECEVDRLTNGVFAEALRGVSSQNRKKLAMITPHHSGAKRHFNCPKRAKRVEGLPLKVTGSWRLLNVAFDGLSQTGPSGIDAHADRLSDAAKENNTADVIIRHMSSCGSDIFTE